MSLAVAPGAVLTEFAPAKINLTLRVLGRRADGYHEIESLVAFADVGDRLELAPGDDLALTVAGPTAEDTGPSSDNLVLKAARALAARVPGLALGRFHLVKQLPVAAGLGGGSADAAAALRLLARLNRLAADDPRIAEAAVATGADVPVCLDPRARTMRGMGDRLSPPQALPPLAALLVNPGVPVPTRDVFAALRLPIGARISDPRGDSGRELMDLVLHTPNDLEPAALALQPVIADVLSDMRALAGCRLARMSGSGATCLGLFDTRAVATAAAARVAHQQSAWWVRPTVLR